MVRTETSRGLDKREVSRIVFFWPRYSSIPSVKLRGKRVGILLSTNEFRSLKGNTQNLNGGMGFLLLYPSFPFFVLLIFVEGFFSSLPLERSWNELFDSIVQSMANFGIRFLFFISYFNTRTLLVDLLSSVDCLMARMHP